MPHGAARVDVRRRNNLNVVGRGETDLIFAHGYGCDQNMGRLLVPAFEDRYRIILYDLVGSGGSDLGAYDFEKYGRLEGHARDLVEIATEVVRGPAVFVGHSVSAMIGLLAGTAAPERFSSHVMIGPSPCYVDDGDYVGGFSRADIDSLLDTLDGNYLGWGRSVSARAAWGWASTSCAGSRGLARAHGGRVALRPDERGGTTIVVSLPCGVVASEPPVGP